MSVKGVEMPEMTWDLDVGNKWRRRKALSRIHRFWECRLRVWWLSDAGVRETDTIGSVVGSVGVRGRGQGHESPTFERFSRPTVRGSLGFRGGFCGVGVFGKGLGVTGGVQPTGLGFVGGGVFLMGGVLRFLRGAGIGVGGLCDDSRVVGARTGGVGGRFLRSGGGGGFQDGGG